MLCIQSVHLKPSLCCGIKALKNDVTKMSRKIVGCNWGNRVHQRFFHQTSTILSWKLGFGSSFLKPSSQPQLLQWFNKLRAHLVNKFTFYFYQMLAQNTAPGDMKTYLSSKNNTDLFLKFQNLQRKCFACAVLLVFDTKNLSPHEWSGPSWQHPEKIHEPSPQYLVMCAHPAKFIDRMPNVVRALNERNPEVLFLDKFSFVYDTEEKCSYLLSSIDPRVTFVAIFHGKKDEKDASTMNYLSEFCTHARGTKVYLSLKSSK